jgi:hypothetical protein
MIVRFIKGGVAAKADQVTCVREDGSVTSGPMPRQGILPHDAFHFVVETTLGWRDAFFGQIARGVTLDQLTAKRTGKKTDWSQWTQALQAESLVECLQAEQWGGAATPELFRRTLGVTCGRRGVATPAIGAADLQRVRLALREFGAAWRPLPPGGVLERKF